MNNRFRAAGTIPIGDACAGEASRATPRLTGEASYFHSDPRWPRMSKMSPGDLRALLAAERADALSAMSASKLTEERAAALDYYPGDMSRDMSAPEGRSKAVSTDVAARPARRKRRTSGRDNEVELT
jgi:hypothetical protein